MQPSWKDFKKAFPLQFPCRLGISSLFKESLFFLSVSKEYCDGEGTFRKQSTIYFETKSSQKDAKESSRCFTNTPTISVVI